MKRAKQLPQAQRFHVGGASVTCPLPDDGLGYVGFFADCELREKAGQKQSQCPDCLLWRWADRKEACDRLRAP